MASSLRRADEGTLVSVLSAEALAQMPQVPWVDDPEPRRQPGQAGASTPKPPHRTCPC